MDINPKDSQLRKSAIPVMRPQRPRSFQPEPSPQLTSFKPPTRLKKPYVLVAVERADNTKLNNDFFGDIETDAADEAVEIGGATKQKKRHHFGNHKERVSKRHQPGVSRNSALNVPDAEESVRAPARKDYVNGNLERFYVSSDSDDGGECSGGYGKILHHPGADDGAGGLAQSNVIHVQIEHVAEPAASPVELDAEDEPHWQPGWSRKDGNDHVDAIDVCPGGDDPCASAPLPTPEEILECVTMEGPRPPVSQFGAYSPRFTRRTVAPSTSYVTKGNRMFKIVDDYGMFYQLAQDDSDDDVQYDEVYSPGHFAAAAAPPAQVVLRKPVHRPTIGDDFDEPPPPPPRRSMPGGKAVSPQFRFWDMNKDVISFEEHVRILEAKENLTNTTVDDHVYEEISFRSEPPGNWSAQMSRMTLNSKLQRTRSDTTGERLATYRSHVGSPIYDQCVYRSSTDPNALDQIVQNRWRLFSMRMETDLPRALQRPSAVPSPDTRRGQLAQWKRFFGVKQTPPASVDWDSGSSNGSQTDQDRNESFKDRVKQVGSNVWKRVRQRMQALLGRRKANVRVHATIFEEEMDDLSLEEFAETLDERKTAKQTTWTYIRIWPPGLDPSYLDPDSHAEL